MSHIARVGFYGIPEFAPTTSSSRTGGGRISLVWIVEGASIEAAEACRHPRGSQAAGGGGGNRLECVDGERTGAAGLLYGCARRDFSAVRFYCRLISVVPERVGQVVIVIFSNYRNQIKFQ